MKAMYTGKVNSPKATLSAAVGAGDVALDFDTSILANETPNLCIIGSDEDAETVLYTAKTATSISGVTRGFQGVARAWPTGTPVYRNFTEYDYAALVDNVVETNQLAQLGQGVKLPDASTVVANWVLQTSGAYNGFYMATVAVTGATATMFISAKPTPDSLAAFKGSVIYTESALNAVSYYTNKQPLDAVVLMNVGFEVV